MNIDRRVINDLIDRALREDEVSSDITSLYSIDSSRQCEGHIIVKEDSIVCGIEIAKAVIKKLDQNSVVKTFFKDGDKVRKNTKILTFKANARAILAAERTALNFIAHLSGISTLTRQFVQAIKGSKAKILDTRKTLPGLRVIEKYAVTCGGGENHRLSLRDMALIKDNHRVLLKDIEGVLEAIRKIRKQSNKEIEVEVDDIRNLTRIVAAYPDMILLDNMSISLLRKAVRIVRSQSLGKKILLEVSGGVNLKTVGKIAQTGVDRISVGALTHSVKSIDFSLEIIR